MPRGRPRKQFCNGLCCPTETIVQMRWSVRAPGAIPGESNSADEAESMVSARGSTYDLRSAPEATQGVGTAATGPDDHGNRRGATTADGDSRGARGDVISDCVTNTTSHVTTGTELNARLDFEASCCDHHDGHHDHHDPVHEDDDDGLVALACANCRRREVPLPDGLAVYYGLELEACSSEEISTGRKFSCVRVADLSDGETLLCVQCRRYLVEGSNDGMVDIWPSFMWQMLRNSRGVVQGLA